MALKWNCLEYLTAIGVGIALAPFDGGMAAGAVIGGSGLLARIKENSRKAGLDDEQLITRMQQELIAQLDHWDSHEERAAAIRADEAMKRLLPQLMLTREQLAATVTSSPDSAERYPVMAARIVVDQLARHDPMFAAPQAGWPDRQERIFALQAVEAALRAAKNDPDYATLLTLDIAIELGRALAENSAQMQLAAEKAEQHKAVSDDTHALVHQLVAAQRESAQRQGMAETTLIALAQKLAEKVSDPAQAALILADHITIYLEMLVKQPQQSNFGADEDAALRRVLELIEAQDFARAVDQGERELARFDEVEREQTERMAARRLRMVDAVIQSARLAVDAKMAAKLLVERARVEAGIPELSAADIRIVQSDYYEHALNRGNRFDMDVAIEFARISILGSKNPVDRSSSQNDLGTALWSQGRRLGGTEGDVLLGEAVRTFRTALKVRTCEELPAKWAMTQHNLGLAEEVLGDLHIASDSLVHLMAAETCQKSALEIFDPAHMPHDHGTATQALARVRAKITQAG